MIDTAKSAIYRDGYMIVTMGSGSELRFPVSGNPRLAHASPRELARVEISPCGLHWPALDEDLSFRGLAEGDYGQHQKTPHA